MSINSKTFTARIIKAKQLFDKDLLTYTELRIEIERLINEIKSADIDVEPLEFISDCSILMENSVLTSEEFDNLKKIILAKEKIKVIEKNISINVEIPDIHTKTIPPKIITSLETSKKSTSAKPKSVISSSLILVFLICVIVIAIIILSIIFSSNKSIDNSTTSKTEQTVKDKENQQVTKEQVEKQRPQANLYSPDGVVVKFIESLGRRDFSAAFGLMTEKRRGSYSQFSSVKGYGGITSTKVFSCSFTGETNGKNEVIVEYESIDPENKSGRFKQYFYLTRYRDSYLITEIKNINIDWY